MHARASLPLLAVAAISCQPTPRPPSTPTPAPEPAAPAPKAWAFVIHGGAGTISRDELTPEREALMRAALEEALRKGHAILSTGGSSLDAVTAAIVLLEDNPYFNAGKGAVFTHEGK